MPIPLRADFNAGLVRAAAKRSRPDSKHVCIGGHCRHARGGRALSRDKTGATGEPPAAGLDSSIIDPVSWLHARSCGNARADFSEKGY